MELMMKIIRCLSEYKKIDVDLKDVLPVIKAAFPNYNIRKSPAVIINNSCTVQISWVGGSIDEVGVVRWDGEGWKAAVMPYVSNVASSQKEINPIPKDVLIVVWPMYNGKKLAARIYVSPDSDYLPKLLN